MATKTAKAKAAQKNRAMAAGAAAQGQDPAVREPETSVSPVTEEKSLTPAKAEKKAAVPARKKRAETARTASAKKTADGQEARSGDAVPADMFSLFAAVNGGFFRLWTQGTTETVKLAEKAARAGSLNDLYELQIDYACTLSRGYVEEGLRIGECAFAAARAAGREIAASGR